MRRTRRWPPASPLPVTRHQHPDAHARRQGGAGAPMPGVLRPAGARRRARGRNASRGRRHEPRADLGDRAGEGAGPGQAAARAVLPRRGAPPAGAGDAGGRAGRRAPRSRRSTRVLVVTPDARRGERWRESRGARVVPRAAAPASSMPPCSAGIAYAARAARARPWCCRPTFPWPRRTSFAACSAATPRGLIRSRGGQPGVTLAPSHDGDGTNAPAARAARCASRPASAPAAICSICRRPWPRRIDCQRAAPAGPRPRHRRAARPGAAAAPHARPSRATLSSTRYWPLPAAGAAAPRRSNDADRHRDGSGRRRSGPHAVARRGAGARRVRRPRHGSPRSPSSFASPATARTSASPRRCSSR